MQYDYLQYFLGATKPEASKDLHDWQTNVQLRGMFWKKNKGKKIKNGTILINLNVII